MDRTPHSPKKLQIATLRNVLNLDNYSTASRSNQRPLYLVAHDFVNDIAPVGRLLGRHRGQKVSLCALVAYELGLYEGEPMTWYDKEKHEEVTCYRASDGCFKSRFKGQHNALNDAIATLKALIALNFQTTTTYSGGVTWPAPKEPPILLALDVEKLYGGDTTEVGFAWLDVADLLEVDEEGRRIREPGEKAKGWHDLIGGVLYRIRPYEDVRMGSSSFCSPPAEDEPPAEQTRVIDATEMLREFTNLLVSLGVRQPLVVGETASEPAKVSIPDPRAEITPDPVYPDLPFKEVDGGPWVPASQVVWFEGRWWRGSQAGIEAQVITRDEVLFGFENNRERLVQAGPWTFENEACCELVGCNGTCLNRLLGS